MVRLLAWFSEHKLVTAVIVALYVAAVTLCHHEVSRIVEWMNATLSFKATNNLMLESSLVIALLVLVATIISFKNGEHKSLQLALWLFTVALVVLSYKTLIVVNVENIHFIQYALLAVPVFALVPRFGETVFWVTLLGALDEAYQYFVLYPNRKDFYFDFNDIVINLAGAGIGIAFIYTFLDIKGTTIRFNAPPRRKWYWSPVFLVTATVACVVAALYMAGQLKFYPGPDAADALILLSRIPASATFWIEPKVGKTFHILSAWEGVFSVAILLACYAFWDHVCVTRKRA